MPTVQRKILIADPDPATVRSLGPLLRARGYQVHAALDGSRALEVAILRFPDLVLFDERAPLIDPRTFVRILRTNPRTERISVVVTGESLEVDRGRLGSFLKKPFNQDEVMSRIDQIFRKLEAARAVTGEKGELEGDLSQIPLVDLIQILAINRKTGWLVIEQGNEKGEITLREGRIVDAKVAQALGEKGLFRILTRREGKFAFVPGTPQSDEHIARRMDELILDGMRQADEVARLLPTLPALNETIELAVPPSEIPHGLHPATEQIVRLLERSRTLAELIDLASTTDLEAMRAVAALLERKIARRGSRRELAHTPVPGIASLLGISELKALKTRIGKGRVPGEVVGKVLLAGGGPLSQRAVEARVSALPGFIRDREAPKFSFGFGTMGQLSLGEGVRVDICELPSDPVFKPLWRPFASGALGAVVLLPADGIDELLIEISRGLRLPIVVCGPSAENMPPALRDAPGGTAFGGQEPAEALRALLTGAGVHKPSY